MSDKPSYLSLLNAIAVGELGGEVLFNEWAAATPNDDVRAVLQTVALREGEHAKSFAKRINELGYSVIPKEDPDLAGRCAIAGSTTLTDCEKFERLGYKRVEENNDEDTFSNFFDDLTMDIRTGEFMGRYVSEERDSVRMLRDCYNAVSAADTMGAAATTALEARLDRIEAALAELAAASRGSTSDGKIKAKK
jgi:rubrerythrin